MITERALRRACLAGQVDEGERFQTKVFLLGWCSVYRTEACVAYAKQAGTRSKRMKSIPNKQRPYSNKGALARKPFRVRLTRSRFLAAQEKRNEGKNRQGIHNIT